MSASRHATIWCDGEDCGRYSDEYTGSTTKQIRAELKAWGWKVALPGGRDFCPECADKTEATR